MDVFLEEIGNSHLNRSELYDKQLMKLWNYDWPGNVRELRNIVERLAYIPDYDLSDILDISDSDDKYLDSDDTNEDEKEIISAFLKECNGNMSAAARKIGISRKTLYKKVQKYGLKPKG